MAPTTRSATKRLRQRLDEPADLGLAPKRLIGDADLPTEDVDDVVDKHEWYCFGRHRPTYRGWLHGVMFISSPLWSIFMLYQCSTHSSRISAGLSLFAAFAQFGASSLYHRGNWKYKHEQIVQQLDFIAISLMIAYSLSPVYALLLNQGWKILASSTVFATLGAGMTLLGASKPLRTLIYLAQGVISSFPVVTVELNTFEMCALGVSLFSYLSGAFVYAFEYPDPSPNHFGYHELWHLLIVIAAMGTYTANISVIGRAQLSTMI
jgi:hemolysin III